MTIAEDMQAMEARPVWDGLWDRDEQGPYFRASRCGACSGHALGQREFCPHCLAKGGMTEVRVGRSGTLYAATTIHQLPEGFSRPYRAGYVDIGHGLRVFAHVSDRPRFGDRVVLTLAVLKTSPSGQPLSGPLYVAEEEAA